ncbi:hypothetical protein GCM10010218_45030 [Streptomyces mashuensis]|uniref:Ricin B lectin domain-containing protein n=1 Tax=Streptomyces mashuensis TaxID=33904 RepID=A0A919B6W1_9ACTN|nr:RICIN domain-containing protein [Streptomyces mashuensis]GHF58705.1 hypothetical protein GCM10010218_45030 [Streptomyces mashuensis]
MSSIPAPAHPPRRRASALRALVVALMTCGIALGLLAAPGTTAPAYADENCSASAPFQCVTLTSASNGRHLDVQNGTRADGAYVVTNSAPGYYQSWRLSVDPKDASFAIINNTTGKCIDLSWPALRQQTCRGGKTQKWYLQPAGGAADTFMIRNGSDGSCLDLIANAQYDDAWTGKSACHAGANQQWRVSAPGARNLAVDHAAYQCQQDSSTCTWVLKSEAPAAPLPKVCASAVWYNNTNDAVQQTFGVTETTGWANTIGFNMTTSLTAGTMPGLTATIAETLVGTHTWQGSKSVNNSVTIPVPPKQYGWVTLSVLAKKVTGTWTFDAHGFPWKAEDTVTVPLRDDPNGGATVYVANAAPTYTACV